MLKITSILLFFHCFLFAQYPDISFNTQAWTTGNNVSFIGNSVTVTGNISNTQKTTLDVNLSAANANVNELYFIAEVRLSGNTQNDFSLDNPQLVIRNTADNSVISRINLNNGINDRWVNVGAKVDQFDQLGIQDITLEVAIRKNIGTFEVRNPYLTDTAPNYVFDYPFDIPTNTSTTFNIDTANKHPFNNDLLSTNSHFTYASYDWGDAAVINAINNKFPMQNYRFPGGTVGNYYDYETDTFYTSGLTPQNLINKALSGYTFNYNAYKDLVISNNGTATLMFNVKTDNVQKSKNRLQNRINSGLNVKWIEMGNEIFFTSEQEGNVSSLNDYITFTQALNTGLKQIDPNVKTAVPLEKDDYVTGGWNETLSNLDYFDAGTVHSYIATGVYFHSNYSLYSMFTGYKKATERINKFQNYFPTKKMLITEWGVTSEVEPPIFAHALSISDMFLAIEEGNEAGVVEQAGIHMLYKNDVNSEATLIYKNPNGTNLRFTTNGFAYSALFPVFMDSEVFNADPISAELIPGLQCVNGKAVYKNGVVTLYMVNKLPNSSALNLSLDGVTYTGNYTMKSFTGDMNASETQTFGLNANPWTTVTSSGTINLPAFSISVIEITDYTLSNSSFNKAKTAIYPNPSHSNFTIQTEELDVHWELYNVTGRLIKKGDSKNVKAENLSSGVYFLKIKNQTFKLIKE